MDSYFNDLKEQATLAPLQEEHLKELYQAQFIGKNDIAVLSAISRGSIAAIETCIGSLSHLISNLKIYKQCVIDAINLQSEAADMTMKYGRDIPKQSHQLPGIVSAPETYDLNAIKADNARMMEVSREKDKAIKQKDIYIRVSQEDVRLFLASWKRLNYQNIAFDQFVESLNDTLNPNY